MVSANISFSCHAVGCGFPAGKIVEHDVTAEEKCCMVDGGSRVKFDWQCL
jgi:hypothetical protein